MFHKYNPLELNTLLTRYENCNSREREKESQSQQSEMREKEWVGKEVMTSSVGGSVVGGNWSCQLEIGYLIYSYVTQFTVFSFVIFLMNFCFDSSRRGDDDNLNSVHAAFYIQQAVREFRTMTLHIFPLLLLHAF